MTCVETQSHQLVDNEGKSKDIASIAEIVSLIKEEPNKSPNCTAQILTSIIKSDI
jgi:hypothetical protein